MSFPAAPDSTSGTVPNTGGAVTQRVMGLPRTLTSPHIDIQELAQFFIQRFGGELSKRVQGLAAGAEKLLKRHNWPGNIRELENTIERAVLLAGPTCSRRGLASRRIVPQLGNRRASRSG